MHNLLVDPVITCRTRQGRSQQATLPGVLQMAAAGELDSFTRLRAHQEHPWHAFLAQLAAIALHQAGVDQPPQDEAKWRDLLRDLTPEWNEDQPWHMTVIDPQEPALLQPPSSNWRIFEQDYHQTDETPDAIDLLVSSKNHMVKKATAWEARPEDWLYALVTLQTMQGFSGFRRYGISRMNKGHSNRPCVSLAPEAGHPGAHLQRDIRALPEARQAIMEAHPYYQERDGIALVWLLPWDGEDGGMLAPERLDPLYIEVCRRIRLTLAPNGRIQARRATSRTTRIEVEERLGRTGDPWTPTSATREGIPLTVSRTDNEPGLSYSRITELLNEERWRPAPLMLPTAEEIRNNSPRYLVARALIRGQGETQGYHQRVIPLPTTPPSAEDEGDTPAQRLGRVAANRLNQVAAAENIMSHAIHTFTGTGGREKRRWTQQAIANLNRDLDQTFLEDASLEASAPPAERAQIRAHWLEERLKPLCRAELDRATAQLPCPAAGRLKSRVTTTVLFERRMRRLALDQAAIPQEKPENQLKEQKEQPMNSNAGRDADNGAQTSRTAATEVVETAEPEDTETVGGTPRPDPLGDAVVRISQQLASPLFPRGDVGALRRMNTEGSYPPVFYQILVRNGILKDTPAGSEREKNWAAIIRGIAVMTPRNLKEPAPGAHLDSAHNPTRSLGQEMYGNDERPRISEQRLNRLMASQGQPLRQLLSQLSHTLKNNPFNWRHAAHLLLSEDSDKEARQAARERIVRHYCLTAEIVRSRLHREEAANS